MPLVRFLERFSAGTRVMPVTAGERSRELSAGVAHQVPPAPAADGAAAAIHLPELANDDAAAARALTDALRRRGLGVWLDKGERPTP
jgi:hypothetical protein